MNIIHILDVSKYNVNYTRDTNGNILKIIDWWKPEKSKYPINAVIQRTSYGMREDEMLDFLYQEVKKIPIRGGYHYYSSSVKWQTQLKTILNSIEDKEYHFLVVDYEKTANTLTKTSFAEVMELTNQLKKATDKKVMLYFNQDIYQNYMKPYGAANVINNYDIWFANYPFMPSAEKIAKGPVLPSGINTWKFWQYGANVFGTAGWNAGKDYGSWNQYIDVNAFNGTIEDLKEWLNISDIVEKPKDESYWSGYYYVKPYFNGSGFGSVIPAITQLMPEPKDGVRETVSLSSGLFDKNKKLIGRIGAVKWWFELNNSDNVVFSHIEKADVAPTKGYNSAGKLIYIPLLFQGNLLSSHNIIEHNNEWYKVIGLDLENLPLVKDYTDGHYEIIHHLWQVDINNKLSPISGLAAKFKLPIFGNWFVRKEKLEKVMLPMDLTVLTSVLNIRSLPGTGGDILGKLQKNNKITIYSLFVRNGIWGRISKDGEMEKWCCLRLNNTLFTNWQV